MKHQGKDEERSSDTYTSTHTLDFYHCASQCDLGRMYITVSVEHLQLPPACENAALIEDPFRFCPWGIGLPQNTPNHMGIEAMDRCPCVLWVDYLNTATSLFMLWMLFFWAGYARC